MFLFIYNLLFQILLVFFIVVLALKYANKSSINKLIVMILVSYHYIITIILAVLGEGQRSDSNTYFINTSSATSWFSEFGISTTFIEFLIYPLIHLFKFNYLSISLIFSSFGLFGFLILYQLINSLEPKIKLFGIDIIILIIMIPSYHIWMSSIGKDSLVFFLSVFIINDLVKKRIFTITTFSILILLTFIRPYIGVFTLLAAVIVFFTNGIYTMKRIFLFCFFILFGLFASFQIFNYLNIDITSFFEHKLNWLSRYSNIQKDGSFLDPLKMNMLEKVFSYLYRPLFFDAKGITQFLVSLENLFFLLLTIKFLTVYKYKYLKTSFIAKVMFFYCVIFLLVQSYLIYNLGLANRQKYMLFPFFLYLLFYMKGKRTLNLTN